MKKLIIKFLYVIVLNLLVLLVFNYNINNIIDVVIDRVGIKEELNNFFSTFINSKNGNSTNQKYEIVSDIDYSMFYGNKIEKTIMNNNIVIYYTKKYREKLISYGISENEVDKLIEDLNYNTNRYNYKIGDKEMIALNFYKIISWNLLKFFIIMAIIINIIILFFIDGINVYKGVGIDLLISGIFISIMSVLISKIFNIRFYYFNGFIILYIFLGIGLIIEYLIYKKIHFE